MFHLGRRRKLVDRFVLHSPRVSPLGDRIEAAQTEVVHMGTPRILFGHSGSREKGGESTLS
jgi:hypothetical protein